jgi:hypothetical protein
MNAGQLLVSLQNRGFTLSADMDNLFVKPRASLTPADHAAIRDNKPDLLKLLRYQFCEPYITEFGELRIPGNAHPRYHWFNGGQPIVATLAELNAPYSVWRFYVARGPHLLTPKHSEICAGGIHRLRWPEYAIVYCVECKYFVETTK